MVQTSGKMLMARRRRTVGAMKSQAMARSERPRTRRANAAGVRRAARSTRPSRSMVALELAVVLEDLGPVLDQVVERLLGGPLVGDDVVVDPLLHREEELSIGRLGPEVLHDLHRLEEALGEGGALGEAGVVQHGLVARVAAERPPLLLHVGLREPLDVLQR